jgi:UDP-glucose:glycoprotein glucosyltransferase
LILLDHLHDDGLASLLKDIKVNRNATMCYVQTIFADWLAEGIQRQVIPDHVWSSNFSLIYTSRRNALALELTVDPFTRPFQRIAEILDYLVTHDVVDLKLLALPPKVLPDSAKSYYRHALAQSRAVFTFLDDSTTYSAMQDMPDSWITESMKANFDLDNILLSELTPGVQEATYVLTDIKADGNCKLANGSFAGGAELALIDARGKRKSDTIVMMANGYWQLAAGPGEWTIGLGGRRSRNFLQPLDYHLVIESFVPAFVRLTVTMQPGMETVKLYDLPGEANTNTSAVNVFSVASGHLYERLLKIMMLSVRRQSVHNVKFWIVKAFLSPQFKATLPMMAQKYNFAYQLVNYKWPQWLYPQFEKQRVIWGYKILFLDVLFPLELNRIVYIDADQIVRTDLIELMKMDFGKAPYAFTPMCESRPETESFRFWKQGSWEVLFRDNRFKYHISALFAVDLLKFRQVAAGDVLRAHYTALAPEPHSLANLDQDLPNYVQAQSQLSIPIFSLPQEWLWCETWCSDESFAKAKTIDLCNNPLTKRPKLDIAKTRIQEWPGLDAEVRNISVPGDEYQKSFLS